MTGICLKAAAIVALCLSWTGAQTFEVASIKPHGNIADTNMSINDAPGGQLNCTNVSLQMLVGYAYDVREYQMLNVPAWAETERYDLLAKPSAEDATHEPPRHSAAETALNRKRTQALLADRFGLKVHEEQREMPVYSLVVAKGGPKLPISTTNTPFPQMSWNNTRVQCKKVTMQRFAQVMLASRMGRYVIDNTGLAGEYDFTMTFQPDEAAPKEIGATSAAVTSAGPTFLTALKEQLGLQLVGARGPAPVLVIDHAEKPSGN